MTIYAITATDERMTMSADVAMASARAFGASATKIHEIDNPDRTRGAGYWRWMPSIVKDAIIEAMLKDWDFIVYMDAGVQVIRDLSLLTARMKTDEHVWLFGNEHNHVEWCKGDVLHEMEWKGRDTDKQAQASVHIWRATPEALRIAAEWDRWCDDPHMIDDQPSERPNHPRFKEHRHPQAVLTNIAYRHGIRLHWWPTEYGHYIKHLYPNDNYPQMFEHHRKRNPNTNEAQQPEWTVDTYQKAMERYA
jgi:hypothetical protein